jgi:hypothetical protein
MQNLDSMINPIMHNPIKPLSGIATETPKPDYQSVVSDCKSCSFQGLRKIPSNAAFRVPT